MSSVHTIKTCKDTKSGWIEASNYQNNFPLLQIYLIKSDFVHTTSESKYLLCAFKPTIISFKGLELLIEIET